MFAPTLGVRSSGAGQHEAGLLSAAGAVLIAVPLTTITTTNSGNIVP